MIPKLAHDLLVQLTEECSEVQKEAMKAIRHDSFDLVRHGRKASIGHELTTELGDVLALINTLIEHGFIDADTMLQAADRRNLKVRNMISEGFIG